MRWHDHGPQSYTGVSVKVANLTPGLSWVLGRTVVDKTGLTGKFDIDVAWTPDQTQLVQPPTRVTPPPTSGEAGTSIFTAFREQLGLKLESRRGPVEILVIERAEKPSEN